MARLGDPSDFAHCHSIGQCHDSFLCVQRKRDVRKLRVGGQDFNRCLVPSTSDVSIDIEHDLESPPQLWSLMEFRVGQGSLPRSEVGFSSDGSCYVDRNGLEI